MCKIIKGRKFMLPGIIKLQRWSKYVGKREIPELLLIPGLSACLFSALSSRQAEIKPYQGTLLFVSTKLSSGQC